MDCVYPLSNQFGHLEITKYVDREISIRTPMNLYVRLTEETIAPFITSIEGLGNDSNLNVLLWEISECFAEISNITNRKDSDQVKTKIMTFFSTVCSDDASSGNKILRIISANTPPGNIGDLQNQLIGGFKSSSYADSWSKMRGVERSTLNQAPSLIGDIYNLKPTPTWKSIKQITDWIRREAESQLVGEISPRKLILTEEPTPPERSVSASGSVYHSPITRVQGETPRT